MKRDKELSLVMNEARKLTNESTFEDLENAIKRGLKNIRRGKYEERKIAKQKRQC